MELKQQVMAFIAELEEQYFKKRDRSALLRCLDSSTSWLGTGPDEISHNLSEAQTALTKEFEEYAGTFEIEEETISVRALSESMCLVYGKLHALPEDQQLDELVLLITLICAQTEHGMKLVHAHFSKPDVDLEHGKYYVPRSSRMNKQHLQDQLENRTWQLQNLAKNMPGGAHQCANDEYFTLVNVSDSFLSLFGYTREELITRFDGRFMNMIHEKDRADVMACLQEQLKNRHEFELEYRILHKNGNWIWILDKGRLFEERDGTAYFYCLLFDNNDRKREQEELRLSLERHQVIMDQATDIIFEWDIANDTLLFSPNWNKRFGYDAISSKISQCIPLSENIHPDDMPAFMQIMRDAAAGVPYAETEFRIRHIDGYYCWCRIRATVQFDDHHKPVKAIGVIIDVHGLKKEQEELRELAQRDALTGLYNKAAVQNLAEREIANAEYDKMQALFIIDVDNFKSVNDCYGHLSGDQLLIDIASTLQQYLRASDIVGRIGGDEFLVYLPELPDREAAEARANTLLKKLNALVPQHAAGAISCSIGAVLALPGEHPYRALYQKADQALYHQKNCGKKGVFFFDPACCNEQYHPNIDSPSV